MTFEDNLLDKNVIIVAHILTTVPAEDLKEYFLNHKVKNLLFIGHPLFYKEGRPGSILQQYREGKLVKQTQHKNIPLPSIVLYIKDLILTLYWVITSGQKWDLVISLDNLNTVAALILRKLAKVRKIIYYCIDYVPVRFNNKLLNNFYHYLDKISVKYADLTWNLTDRMAEGREQIRGLDRKVYNRQICVPIGVWFDRFRYRDFKDIHKHHLVYAGGLLPHQGIQLVLEAIPQISEKIKNFKFLIIGIGEYEKDLKDQVKKLKIENFVEFLGYFENHKDVEAKLAMCGLAVAMYNKDISRWSYYADPSKIKSYLAAGLPVITTSLTHISPDIQSKKCGVVIDYKVSSLTKAIIDIFSNSKKHKLYRNNAIAYAKSYDWDDIFTKGLEKLENV